LEIENLLSNCHTIILEFILTILFVLSGEVKFYIVFLVVNNYDGDVVVSTGLPGTSGQITMRTGDTFVLSEQPNNDNPISVTAVDTATSGKIDVNGQSSVSITPSKIFGESFQVLFLYREDPSRCIIDNKNLLY
jgi:hypothetical protein